MHENLDQRVTAFECRALESNGKRYIEGYALLYEHMSKLIYNRSGSFYEIIKRGALDDFLKGSNVDIIATPNHNYSQVLARTVSKTLELINDSKGLKYRILVPNTTFGNDIYESIKRGDTYESSFTFYADPANITMTRATDGNDIRTIKKISFLYEVGPVTSGAYADTIVNARDLQLQRQANGSKKGFNNDPESLIYRLKVLDLKRLF